VGRLCGPFAYAILPSAPRADSPSATDPKTRLAPIAPWQRVSNPSTDATVPPSRVNGTHLNVNFMSPGAAIPQSPMKNYAVATFRVAIHLTRPSFPAGYLSARRSGVRLGVLDPALHPSAPQFVGADVWAVRRDPSVRGPLSALFLVLGLAVVPAPVSVGRALPRGGGLASA